MVNINPNTEQAKAFMQIIYSFCMADNKLEPKEKDLMNSIGKDVFSLQELDRIDLNEQQMIDAVGKIKDWRLKYYLVAFVLEIGHLAKSISKTEVRSWVTRLIKLCDFPDETKLKVKNVMQGYQLEPKDFFTNPQVAS